jgi:4-hydroxybenzoate polyprenyltransferase/phosphoserine phosphatase
MSTVHEQAQAIPLYVDLDGTILSTDLLWESLIELARKRPWDLPKVAVWLLRGRAHLKRQIAGRVSLDVAALPYRADVVEYLRRTHEEGRTLVLATASDEELARGVADYLGLFDDVIGSDGRVNRKGRAKLQSIKEHMPGTEFDYMGDSRADLPLWSEARRSIIVASSSNLADRVKGMQSTTTTEIIPAAKTSLKSLVRELRPHQWSKNLLVFLPLLTAHHLREAAYLLPAFLAFCAFCLAASGVYILNDLLDLNSDRRHHKKRRRPLAAGELSIPLALVLMGGMFLGAAALCLTLPWRFAMLLLTYTVLTTAYSAVLKRKLMVDVICLASLYTLRIMAGGAATFIPISTWLMAFSMFFFLSLAFAKRYTELDGMDDSDKKIPGRGYRRSDLELIRILGPVSGYLCVLVFSLYINSREVATYYARPTLLWLSCPLLLYWISRLWFLAHRSQLPHDPVAFALTDRISYLTGLFLVVILAAASFQGI